MEKGFKLSSFLLVDDDLIATFLNKTLIKKLSICKDIETALNGQEALKKLNTIQAGQETFPTLIFLDINMPIMDGFEFMEAFNRLNISLKEHITVVVLTSSENENDLIKMKNLGIKFMLDKPLSEEKIYGVLKQMG
jgi:CheY-like chemotaxis protein